MNLQNVKDSYVDSKLHEKKITATVGLNFNNYC